MVCYFYSAGTLKSTSPICVAKFWVGSEVGSEWVGANKIANNFANKKKKKYRIKKKFSFFIIFL